jgi:hypothetical protein
MAGKHAAKATDPRLVVRYTRSTSEDAKRAAQLAAMTKINPNSNVSRGKKS